MGYLTREKSSAVIEEVRLISKDYPIPMSDGLDFWNYPDWLGGSRDNPRDPRYEPFWMRPPCRLGLLINRVEQQEIDIAEATAIIRGANGEIFKTKVFSK